MLLRIFFSRDLNSWEFTKRFDLVSRHVPIPAFRSEYEYSYELRLRMRLNCRKFFEVFGFGFWIQKKNLNFEKFLMEFFGILNLRDDTELIFKIFFLELSFLNLNYWLEQMFEIKK